MRHQVKGSPQPISCVTMFTPEGLVVSDDEQYLRGRALQLGETFGEESAEHAIVEIMRVLKSEGMNNLMFERDDGMGFSLARNW